MKDQKLLINHYNGPINKFQDQIESATNYQSQNSNNRQIDSKPISIERDQNENEKKSQLKEQSDWDSS